MKNWLPKRDPSAHKGDFGHVLVVGGSRGMTGAAVLAGRAALRTGAGLTTVAVPESAQTAVSQVPELQTLGLPENASGAPGQGALERLREAHARRRYSVLALGPGLSRYPDAVRFVVGVLDALKIPAVIDADALNALGEEPAAVVKDLFLRRGAACVLTPHPGEMARLCKTQVPDIQADRVGFAQRLSSLWGAVCLLKGKGTVVTDGARTVINKTGNPGLAKGGSGDVLTGVIAAIWAQRLGAAKEGEKDRGFEAAVLGAHLHGLSADIAVKRATVYGLIASDVIEALPEALRKILQ